jgi:hypothetical protein
VGYTTVGSQIIAATTRRAMPFTMPEDGTIECITMYHSGGSGDMILGLYDGASLPGNRLGVTASTAVCSTTGWQSIELTSPVVVSSGTKIWLAWVYQNPPNIYYNSGTPGRASTSATWSGGMPNPFGSSTTANFLYSIYASYTPGGGGGPTYCTSSGNSQGYEWIAGVQVGSLNKTSGASPYSDYTGMTVNLTKGVGASVTLTPGFAGSSYTEVWRIWIDLNQDGDFADTGEQLFSGSGSGNVTGTLTVPTSATNGNTRMRVSMRYSSAPPYCGSFDYGEVEDYTANIQ